MEDMKSLINKIKFVAVEEFIADNGCISERSVSDDPLYALVILLFRREKCQKKKVFI